jgi:L-threonylcarbamoyladenylate synthase
MLVVKPNQAGIKQAVAVLKKGGVIVFPTDTAYGLGGKFASSKVIKKVLKIKNRADRKFTLVAASLSQVEKYFTLNATQKKLAKRHWPGPLSIVVSKNYSIRVPSNKTAVLLARQVGQPLIATSANISGRSTLYSSRSVIKEFAGQKIKPDLLIDAGKLKTKKTSTIVEILVDEIQVIRQGDVRV